MSTGFQKDRNIVRQTDRQSDRLTDRQTERQKDRKTKVVKNVNRMSEKQSRILYGQLKSPLLFRHNLFITLTTMIMNTLMYWLFIVSLHVLLQIAFLIRLVITSCTKIFLFITFVTSSGIFWNVVLAFKTFNCFVTFSVIF